MSVKDGLITLPDGMSYRLLVLPETGRMTPPLLRKIKELAQAGATIVGPPRRNRPASQGFRSVTTKSSELAGRIWGEGDASQTAERRLGAGRVFRQREPEKVLGDMGIAPDFTSGEPLRFIHRRADGTDIYFVANRTPRRVTHHRRISGRGESARSCGGLIPASWSGRQSFRKAAGGRASAWRWAPAARCS